MSATTSSRHLGFKSSVAFGWASAAISAVVGLAVIPLQLRFLGAEAFGLIGFCVTIQSVLMILDLGMTATVNREVARSTLQEDRAQVAGLLGAMDWICWCLMLVCAGVIAVLAPSMASMWLKVVILPIEVVTQALTIAGFLVAIRWPVALYQSALLGAHHAVLNSALNTTAAVLGAAAGVAALAYISADVRMFMASQVVVGLIHLLALRLAVGRVVLGPAGWICSFGEVRRVWQFSALTGLVTAIGVCFMQLDKLILSNLLPLQELGYYTLATLVASGMYVVTMPVFNVVYPRFSALLAAERFVELEQLYRATTHILVSLLVPTGIVLALFSHDLLAVWTGNADVALNSAPLVSLLSLGCALHGIMFVPFALTLAHGAVSLALKINAALFICVGPLVVAGALTWNAKGAAAAWLLLHVMYLGVGGYATHRALLPRLKFRWLYHDVGVPLVWASAVGLLGASMAAGLELSPAGRIAFAGGIWVAGIAIAIMASPLFRQWVSRRLAVA